MTTSRRTIVLLAGCLLLAAGCRYETVVLRAASPVGNGEALVIERASIDPPTQILVLEPPDHRTRLILQHLGSDSEWCNEIAWAADGSRVAFLVKNRRLVVYDSGGNPLADLPLLGAAGEERLQARNLTLSADGRRADYDVCTDRDREHCPERRSLSL